MLVHACGRHGCCREQSCVVRGAVPDSVLSGTYLGVRRVRGRLPRAVRLRAREVGSLTFAMRCMCKVAVDAARCDFMPENESGCG